MSEIEKQFFEVFEIEPEYKTCPFKHCIYKKEYDCDNCDNREWHYPQITDRILLELICILNQICVLDYDEVDYYVSSNYKDLKQEIISQCNRLANKNAILETNEEDFRHQVRTLFKENN